MRSSLLFSDDLVNPLTRYQCPPVDGVNQCCLYNTCRFAVMSRCWNETPEDRPGFSELHSIMDNFLSLVSGYTLLRMAVVQDQPKSAILHEVEVKPVLDTADHPESVVSFEDKLGSPVFGSTYDRLELFINDNQVESDTLDEYPPESVLETCSGLESVDNELESAALTEEASGSPILGELSMMTESQPMSPMLTDDRSESAVLDGDGQESIAANYSRLELAVLTDGQQESAVLERQAPSVAEGRPDSSVHGKLYS